MAARHPGAPPDESGGDGASRQNRQDRLGRAGFGQALHAARRHGLTGRQSEPHFPFPSLDQSEGKLRKEPMTTTAKWSGPGLGQSAHRHRAVERAAMLGAQSAIPIVAGGHEPRSKAEYMTAPVQPPTPSKNACATGAVHT